MSGLRSMIAWPMWTLRDSYHPSLDQLTKTDLIVIVSMLMLNVEVQPLGLEGDDEDGYQARTPGEFTVEDVARQYGLCEAVVRRSIRRLRDELHLLEEIKFGGKPPWRKLILPAPPRSPPVNRIDITPFRWIGESNVSITAKSVMTMLWLWRPHHITRVADRAEMVNPRIRTLARAARCDRRSLFDNAKHRAGYRRGALSELEGVGWVAREEVVRGKAIKRYIRLVPSRVVEEANVSKLLLDLYDAHRRERRQKPLNRVQAVLQQLADMDFWLDSMAYDAETYAKWAFTHLSPSKPGGSVSWIDLVGDRAREAFREWMLEGDGNGVVIDLKESAKKRRRRQDEDPGL